MAEAEASQRDASAVSRGDAPAVSLRDRPLRVALNHTRLADAGGVEAYLFRWVHALLERGHRVDYYCARVEQEIKHPRFCAVVVPRPRRPQSLRVALFATRSRRAIARAELEARYDVVQGFGRTCYQTLYRDGSGCHADFRAAYLDRVKRRGAQRLRRRGLVLDAVVQQIERARYARRPPRVVLAISRMVREQILRRYALDPERVRVLYTGVDLERYHPGLREAGRAALCRAIGAEPPAEDRRVLAFVGSDFGRKGLDLLFEALARLESDPALAGSRHALAVVGRDPREESWRRTAAAHGVSHRVHFLGFRRDVPLLLAGCDGLVLPSWFDPFGNVIAEALACGAPVVASASCGGAEWIRDGENGFALPRQDAALLAERLRALLGAELGPLRLLARRSALAYGWDAHVEALLAVYREIAASADLREG